MVMLIGTMQAAILMLFHIYHLIECKRQTKSMKEEEKRVTTASLAAEPALKEQKKKHTFRKYTKRLHFQHVHFFALLTMKAY